MAADAPLPALPENAVLVHIGMHKTGTTAMQTVLGASREALLQRGVLYPGPRNDHHVAARSLIQRDFGPGGVEKAPPPLVWTALAGVIATEQRRVVLSSEFFSAARGDQPGRLVHDLGPDRVHVLLGVRNTVQSVTSAWQQTLKQGRISDVDRWARTVIPRPGKPAKERSFWSHWDLGAVVHRWAEAAGAENMTVVVVDGQDRERLPATFERLLDLEPGFLTGQQPPISNRGMTAREAELVRELNTALRGELDWPDYRRIVRYGVIRSIVESVQPGPDEPRPQLPKWAQDEVRAAGERAAREIAASGVRVVGDLAELHAEASASDAATSLDVIPTDVAVAAIVGAVRADGTAGVRRVEDVPAREMVRILARRAKNRARRAVRDRRRR
jgi:hypothetical protein